MTWIITRTLPDGTRKHVEAPAGTDKREAARYAALSLRDNTGISNGEARVFLRDLFALPTGEELKHRSGYIYRLVKE